MRSLFIAAVLLCIINAVVVDGVFCQASQASETTTSSQSANLVLLSDTAKSGAVCLDGSAPGYFFRPGKGGGSSKWLLYLQGGAWCYDEKECAERSKGDLGSSKNWPQSVNNFKGLLSDDKSQNPDFYEWNFAYIVYCDGASFAGNVDMPHTVDGTNIYFRGFRILKETLNSLLAKGMKDATEVILTGCSSGGLAVYFHADYVQSVLKPSVKFRALSDGGYFLDIKNIKGQYHIRQLHQQVFKMQNCKGGVDQDCIKAYQQTGEEWKCFFAEYTYPYIKSHVFSVNSEVDTWQLDNVLQLGCIPPDCNDEQLKNLTNFNKEFIIAALPIIKSKDNGAFLDACLIHCQIHSNTAWNKFTINGQSTGKTFADWYYDKCGKIKGIDLLWPSNKTCR